MVRGTHFVCAAGVALTYFAPHRALAQTALPTVTVDPPARKQERPVSRQRSRIAAVKGTVSAAAGASRRAGTIAPSVDVGTSGQNDGEAGLAGGPPTPAQASEAVARARRDHLLPKTGSNVTMLTKQDIQTLPAGDNTPFDRVILQLPGVTQDSAGSGDFHIRNEHANVQYRINGIFLPEGVSGFSQVLSTSFIGTLALIDGALPAQYGLRTAGIIDIQSRIGADQPGGTLSVYGGSHGTIIPTIDYAGTYGRWDYFFTGRYETSRLGIENTLPTHEAEHDRTRQGRYFAYASGLLEDGSRLTFMSGATIAKYHIPNSPGVPPAFTAFGVTDFDSSLLNENQVERSIFNVLAWQKSFGVIDSQVSYFQRYSTLHFVPDTLGDLVFNGVASDVTRTSLVNGIQNDNAVRTSGRNTVRFGFTGNIERAQSLDANVILPTDANGNAFDAPFTVENAERKTGYVAGIYLQDEFQLTPQITINGGLRFDYMHQYVDANQLSPRLGIDYKPFSGTVFHAGYARYFTPPELALAAPSPTGLYTNTTLAPAQDISDPVRPERSHYFDLGVTQRVLPGLDVGIDGYYKIAKNLIDDGQFGQALVLTAFNYDHAYNKGVELKANYVNGGFRAYGNIAIAKQEAEQVSSNQYLFDVDELAYIRNHYIYTDHTQILTVSGGASYRFGHSTISTDLVYGSGLRDGLANTGTVSPYATVNIGATHDFYVVPGGKPTTLRVTVVNVFDHAYEIRDGSGIGVFAPQYGQRRGFFAGLSQRF